MRQDNKGKAALLGLFLLAGGGASVYFALSGAADLAGPGGAAYRLLYSGPRRLIMPLLKPFGVESIEEKIEEANRVRMEARLQRAFSFAPNGADISDWVEPSRPGQGKSAGPRSAAAPTCPAVARMAGGLSAAGSARGGATSTSGSRFRPGSASGETSVRSGGTARGASAGGGTLASLKTTRTSLAAGLRSGSAAEARAQWDRSFGLGSGSGQGSQMAYERSGMVNLDKIKKGEVAALKMEKKESLKDSEVGAPEMDVKASNSALSSDKDYQKEIKAMKKKREMEELLASVGGAVSSDSQPNSQPVNIQGVSTNGAGCTGAGCPVPGGGYIKDNAPTVNPLPQCMCCQSVSITGTQTLPDGGTIFYEDTIIVNADGQVLPGGSSASLK